MGEVFGVEDGGSAALGGLEDQGVPIGNFVAGFDLEGGQNRLGSVDDDLPTQVILDELSDLGGWQWVADSAAQIHAELLQNLGAESALSGGPKMFEQLASAFVFEAGIAIAGRGVVSIDKDVGIDEIPGSGGCHRW
jgi:hypothetical protein